MNDGAAPDEFHRLLAEHWDRILAAADEHTRAELMQLVGEADRDPREVQAELMDLLLDVLPVDHPILAYLRDRPLLQATVEDGPTLADRQDWLRHVLSLDVLAPAGQPDPSRESPSSGAPDPPGSSTPPWLARPPVISDAPIARRDLIAEVRRGLLQVPSYDADEVATWAGETALIRLHADDGTSVVPAFQFVGEPVGTGAAAAVGALPSPAGLRPVVVETNRMLWADRDPWGASSWWVYPHAVIGVPPVELLGGEHEDWLPALARRLGQD